MVECSEDALPSLSWAFTRTEAVIRAFPWNDLYEHFGSAQPLPRIDRWIPPAI
jgi:hypothetical protein